MPNIIDIITQITKLTRTQVLVGIPQEKAARPGSRINNAALAYIHETGSPAANIPARPFLQPGMNDTKAQWLKKLEAAGLKAANGEDFEQLFKEAGTIAVRGITQRMLAGIPPPLSKRTVANRRRRSAGSKYRRQATTAADVTPLVDTKSLLRSISYVIRKR